MFFYKKMYKHKNNSLKVKNIFTYNSKSINQNIDYMIAVGIWEYVLMQSSLNKRPMGNIPHLKNQFKSINTFE